MAEWVIQELNAQYGVPRNITIRWLDLNDLILLLDGLDEVQAVHRATCLEALNHFHQTRGFSGLAICSRFQEYQALTNRLNVGGAVILQPLTLTQVDQHLFQAGPQLAGLRAAIRVDKALQELAPTPLFLHIMCMVYQGIPADGIVPDSTEAGGKHQQLIDDYIHRVLKRSGTKWGFTQSDVLKYLSWLAKKMMCHNNNLFFFEQLQPSWLDRYGQKVLYVITSRALAGIVMCLVVGWLWFIIFWIPTTTSAGFYFPICLLAYPVLAIALAILVIPVGALLGSLIGLVALRKSVNESIAMIDTLEWSAIDFRRNIRRDIKSWFNQIRYPGILNDFPIVHYRLALRVTASLGSSLVATFLDQDFPIVSKQFLWRSLKNGFLAGVLGAVYGIIFLSPFLFLSSVFSLLTPDGSESPLLTSLIPALLAWGILLGPLFAAIGFLKYGGLAFIQHVALRFVLRISHTIPRSFADLLDYATSLNLLRKVGGGYIFIHRLLMEYFASLTLEDIERLAEEQ